MISFIHLSDIHFRRCSGDSYDNDDDLRNEMLIDIRGCFGLGCLNPRGILVCGDVAFSGQQKEYEIANDFLAKICGAIGINKNAVYCVPGNHDVDQNIPKNEVAVKLLQEYLENARDQNEFDYRLASIMRGEYSATALMLPISKYQEEFAARYDCYMEPKELGWEHEININEEYNIRLFGLNSVLISNADDHKPGRTTERLMHLGRCQMPKRKQNTILLTLCHHPTECWNDQTNELKSLLDNRATIQFYGHKHDLKLASSQTSLYISSGAVHPSRDEPGWIPTYNWISLEIQRQHGQDYLEVRILPRVYSQEKSCFVDNASIANEQRRYLIPLGEVNAGSATPEARMDAGVVCRPEWSKQFAYDFMNLPPIQRDKILRELGLDRTEDKDRRHYEYLREIVQRAEQMGCEDELLRRIKS